MKRALIVDDDPLIRSLLREALESLEFEVDEKEHGEAAREVVEKNQYDLILLDLVMPGLSGNELVHKIREGTMNRRSKIVIASAYRLATRRSDPKFEALVDLFLEKPIYVLDAQRQISKLFEEKPPPEPGR